MLSLELLQELVSIPGPPGEEDCVRNALVRHLDSMGVGHETDAKGNLIVRFGSKKPARVVVTAHMDEIALYVRQILPDGSLKVGPLGGIFPWKLGEGAVSILGSKGELTGILGFGSIHTESELSPAKRAKSEALVWGSATVLTGLTSDQLANQGVRPGTRVVVAPNRRQLTRIGSLVGGYFLDDRADLVSWLLAIQNLKGSRLDVTFVATTSEEVGGQGALFFLAKEPAEIMVALELGPNVPDAPVVIDARPTVWVIDGYASMPPHLGETLNQVSKASGIEVQFQALSRGGSDASCAAGQGHCAHPITLGLPMENSHGYEVIHEDSMSQLADFTVELLKVL